LRYQSGGGKTIEAEAVEPTANQPKMRPAHISPPCCLDITFALCSHGLVIEYGELSFKIVRLEPGGQEVIARAGNYEICKAAFDKALFVYPTQHLELRQGARVICKSKEDRTSAT
jgi:hypothetical protein